MKRFGEIPISPDDKQGRPGKKRQDPDVPAGEPSVTLSSEPELTGGRPVLEPALEPAPEPAPESAPESFTPPPPRRVPAKKKKRNGGRLFLRSALWFLVPVCIVLLCVAGSYFFVPYYIKGPLARALGEQLERPVEISRAVFSPFSLRLFIEDITIGPKAGEQNQQVLLECPRIDCRLALARISSGQLICENIAVKGLVMRINRDVAVSSDLAAAWRLIVPAANMTKTSLWPEWLLPGEITLTGGTLLIDDPAAQKQYRMEQVELYLPPLDPKPNAEDRLPRLSAVINASPVQVEAVQVTDSNGRMETRFDLKIKSLVLANYVQTLPVLDQQLKLAEGQADLELSLIFPQTGAGGQRILLEGSSALTAVKVVDQEGTTVLSVPSAQLNFQIAPLAQRYRFSRITLDNPKLNLLAKAPADKDHGLTMADMGSVLMTPVRLPLNLGIDRLQLNDGAVHIALPGPAKKELSWNKVSFSLEHFASPGVSLEEKKGGPARFILKAVDNSTDKGVNLTGEGEILPDGGVNGQLSIEQFNLLHYQDLLPQTEVRFVQGRGNLRFTFATFKPEAGAKEKKEKVSAFRVTGGELGVAEYALEVNGKKAAAGGTLRCSEVQAEPAAHRLTCSELEFTDSEIFTPGALTSVLGRPAKGKLWQLDAQNLRLKGVKLHVPLLQALCSAKNDLVLKNFQAEAKDLTKENVHDNITAQGSVGGKGIVKVSGGYSLAQAGGNLQIDLQHLDFALFDPCLSQVAVPKVKQGTINIQGKVTLPAREFSGQMWVNDLVAGEEDGPSVSWQLATSDRVTLRTEPLHLDLGEVMVRKPVVQPGLLDTENLLHNFFKPGKPAFQNLAISKVSFEDGRFIPFRPVLLPGYQPRLEGVSGSITALGQKVMPFSFSGKVGDLGGFTVTGKAGMDRVESYSLEMPSVSLVSFADFFLTNMGMSVESAQGKWQQTMSRADNVVNVATAVRFQGLQPVAESPLLLVSALLLGKNGELLLESREDVADGSEPPFLLTSVQRQLQRQGVRADISKELVLREYFPQLQLPPRISFAPGLAEPLGAEGLAGYSELFDIRPYLGLHLHAVIDNETDREALRQMLQQEADLKREAENSRRALVKLQREEEEKKRLAEIKAGKTPVVSEEIAPEELTDDLEPLPYVQVEVTEAMLAELAIQRLHAVQAYLQQQLSVEPARVQVGEGFSDGAPQVELQLVPVMAGKKPE